MGQGEFREIILTAAHGGVSAGRVPIGGGAAVAEQLLRHWGQSARCRLTVLGLGESLDLPGVDYHQMLVRFPPGLAADDLVRLNELAYARVCRDFEQAVTDWILARSDRAGCCVLANDLSEGPDFARLAAAGVPVVALWHVDVVDYFARFYLGGLAPHRLTAWQRRLGADCLLPDVLQLVFRKQAEAVQWSDRHIVPSRQMRDVIASCYPGAAERVEVVPWGCWVEPVACEPAAVAAWRQELALDSDEVVLLTLSRLSPEKGVERLLEALALGERQGPLPVRLRLVIAGQAAFMMGARYERKLRRLAADLRQVTVDFVGHVGGDRKAALWSVADIYCFCSRHESYGLTLAEALRAGLPVISTAHYSARDLIPPDAGWIVPNGPEPLVRRALWRAVRDLASQPTRRQAMAAAAARCGARLEFAQAADRVLDICRWAAGRR